MPNDEPGLEESVLHALHVTEHVRHGSSAAGNCGEKLISGGGVRAQAVLLAYAGSELIDILLKDLLEGVQTDLLEGIVGGKLLQLRDHGKLSLELLIQLSHLVEIPGELVQVKIGVNAADVRAQILE